MVTRIQAFLFCLVSCGISFVIGYLVTSSTPDVEVAFSNSCLPPGVIEGECPFDGVNDLNGNDTQTVSGIPYQKGSRDPDAFARRIEWQVTTTDDMQRSIEFYAEVLGGTEISFCAQDSDFCVDGAVRYSGDVHLNAIFHPEIAAGEEAQVPNIGDSGDYEVRSRFVVIGNGVVHLMQFANKTAGDYYDMREPLTSPGILGATHMCFWVEPQVNQNDYVWEVESESQGRGWNNVAWNRPVPQETRDDRATVPKDDYTLLVECDCAFDGLTWSYWKGPSGEQLELYQMSGIFKEVSARAYCDRGAVSAEFIDTPSPNADKPTTARLHGMFQNGHRTKDLHRAIGFYTEVMGGDLFSYPAHGTDIHGDSAHWMIFANETIEAYEYAAASNVSRADAMHDVFGVPNISSGGRLDHRFILFDNFVVEPLLYTEGESFGGTPFVPEFNHSYSPAFIGTIGAAYGITHGRVLETELRRLKALAVKKGFSDVPLPDLDAGAVVADFAEDHPFSGLRYTYGKGESNEMLVFVDIGGNFRTRLEEAFLAHGGLSTAFDSTNPYANDGPMAEFCDSLNL